MTQAHSSTGVVYGLICGTKLPQIQQLETTPTYSQFRWSEVQVGSMEISAEDHIRLHLWRYWWLGSYLEALGENLFPHSEAVCRLQLLVAVTTEVLVSLLAIVWGPLSALRGCSQVWPVASPLSITFLSLLGSLWRLPLLPAGWNHLFCKGSCDQNSTIRTSPYFKVADS